VDGNLRTPSQQEIFDLQERRGLSDIMASRAGPDVITKIGSFVDLSVLAAGTLPPNPQELLGRAIFRSFNEQLEARYDVVIYDSPAFEFGSDALALAAVAGGVILTARNHKTSMKDLEAIARKVKSSGAEVVGTVLLDY
jgi:protein-tyrosine kinase